jgi:hypothetical protein
MSSPNSIGTSAPPRPPARPGRKAVGIFLAPGQGRLTALAIVGMPLIIFLLIGFKTTGGGGVPAGNSGYQAPAQSQYPQGGAFGTTQSAYGSGYSSPASNTASATQSTPTDSPTPAASRSATSTTGQATATGPAATVLAAYAAVNRRDYQAAYALGLDNNQETYAVFVQNYTQFAGIAPVIQTVQGDVVTATLTITYRSGLTQTASSTYTVSRGVITYDQIQ